MNEALSKVELGNVEKHGSRLVKENTLLAKLLKR